jgi:hypothetical protein
MGEMRMSYKILIQKLEGRPDADQKTMLRLISRRQDFNMWTAFRCLQTGSAGRLL